LFAIRDMTFLARASKKQPGDFPGDRASSKSLDLDNYVPAFLTFLANKLSSGASAVYRRKFGIGITDWRIMALLAIEPWVPAGRICEVIGLDKAAVSRSVRDMAAIGLVETQVQDCDQRRQFIALTREGIVMHDAIVDIALERERSLLADLSEEERRVLVRLLTRMHARLSIVNACGEAEETE
jgi:DNA-binding MarR family transcriptional regulator